MDPRIKDLEKRLTEALKELERLKSENKRLKLRVEDELKEQLKTSISRSLSQKLAREKKIY